MLVKTLMKQTRYGLYNYLLLFFFTAAKGYQNKHNIFFNPTFMEEIIKTLVEQISHSEQFERAQIFSLVHIFFLQRKCLLFSICVLFVAVHITAHHLPIYS